MDVGVLFPVLLTCLFAAFVQSSCGMGFTTLATAILPFFLPFQEAVAVSCMTALIGNILLMLRYRRSIKLRLVTIPSVCAVVVTALIITLLPPLKDGLLKRVYGGVLLLVAAMFLLSGKIKIRHSVKNDILTGSIVGITNGLFSVGGPFMAVYLLNDPDRQKDEYIGSIQAFFFTTSLAALFFRGVSGLISLPVVKMSLTACLAVGLGFFLGFKVFDKLNFTSLKKIIYFFIGLMGLYLTSGL